MYYRVYIGIIGNILGGLGFRMAYTAATKVYSKDNSASRLRKELL